MTLKNCGDFPSAEFLRLFHIWWEKKLRCPYEQYEGVWDSGGIIALILNLDTTKHE